MSDQENRPRLGTNPVEVEEFFHTVEAKLVDEREAISRGKRPHWDAYADSYLSGAGHLELIKKYDGSDGAARALLFDEEGGQVAQVLLTLLAKVNQPEVVKYLLVLCDELLDGAPVLQDQRVQTFLNVGEDDAEGLPAAPFISLLDQDDAFIRYCAGKLGGLFIWKMRAKARDRDVNSLVRWSITQLQKKNSYATRSAIKALQNALQNPDLRPKFHNAGGLEQLRTVFAHQYQAVMDSKQGKNSKDRDLQLIYEAAFCVWLLSFDEDIANDVSETRLVWFIAKLCQELDNEKIRRISLLSLRNLSGHGGNDEQMVSAGFPKVLKTLLSKKWGDEDISADLEYLAAAVEQKMLDMTTFDRYREELLSGELQWSPVHKSERFWKENVTRLSERNFELVGVLTTLLEADSEFVQSIACYDLGEFARFHPQGKRILHEYNIKAKVMKLIDSPSPEVQQQSLLALQKIMLFNWSVGTK